MLTASSVIYEIRFEVEHRDRFDEWFPEASVRWGTLPSVEFFEVYRGVDGDRELIRVVFGFAEYRDWDEFVRHDAHHEAMAMLDVLSTGIQTALWTPGAVSFAEDEPGVVGVDRDFREAAGGDTDAAKRLRGGPIEP